MKLQKYICSLLIESSIRFQFLVFITKFNFLTKCFRYFCGCKLVELNDRRFTEIYELDALEIDTSYYSSQ